jgi:tetratricopeptide (TPR) repeat protein
LLIALINLFWSLLNKMMLSRVGITLSIISLLILTSGCGLINRIRAKNELNEGANAYKSRKYPEAQSHFERALQLDPNQKNAPFFVARAIHAQYKPGVDSQENLNKAHQAIEAYQRVLAKDPDNEEAYNAVAYLFGAIKDEEKQREWITKRANLETVSKEKRSEAYTVLASKEWDCSYKITEAMENKQTIMKDNKAIIQFKKPKEQKDFDKAQQCVNKGLELTEKAISLNPENESAWSYKTNLLRERAKLAEMDGKTDEKDSYAKQADAAQVRTTELSEKNRKRREAEEAKKQAEQTS